jgi:hypothetical protein
MYVNPHVKMKMQLGEEETVGDEDYLNSGCVRRKGKNDFFPRTSCIYVVKEEEGGNGVGQNHFSENNAAEEGE